MTWTGISTWAQFVRICKICHISKTTKSCKTFWSKTWNPKTRQCTYLYGIQIILDEIFNMYRILILTLFQTPYRIDMLSKIWRQHRCRSIFIKAQKYSVTVSFYARIWQLNKTFEKFKFGSTNLNIFMLEYKVKFYPKEFWKFLTFWKGLA